MNITFLRKCGWILSAGLLLIGLFLLVLREPAVTYLYRHPVELPFVGDILEGRDVHPLVHYLHNSDIMFSPFAVFLIKTALMLAVASAVSLSRRVDALIERLLHASADQLRSTGILFTLILIGYLVALVSTPQIDFGNGKEHSGYGHDGVYYGRMADDFTPFETRVYSPFCYRVLPSVLVFYLGIGTFHGFHLVNSICYALSCLLVYRLLRFYRVERLLSIVGVGFFIFLKFGLKFWLYYPILTDGLGTLLLFGILFGAVSGKHLLYLSFMVSAVFCRENLLALIPFHALCLLQRSKPGSKTGLLMLLNLVPVAVLVMSRRFPCVLPVGHYDALSSAWTWGKVFLLNPTRQVEFFLAYINSLGVLAVYPFFEMRTTRRFLRQNACWSYFLLVNLAFSVVGGKDIDRFALWQAPLLIVLVMRSFSLSAGPHLVGRLLLLQAVWSELFIPWRGDVSFYFSRYAVHSHGVKSLLMELSCIVFLVLFAVIYKAFVKVRPKGSWPTNEWSTTSG
ncbi:MAG: hypothetical protein NT096_04770 [Proteobacteria bacterium]|nr:hypothetical protein [Pseudomonadota bacterium]